MASGSGPRALGTDGKDHKFRQRVDDHYKIMAQAKRNIRTAARLQLMAALGFAAVAGPLAASASQSTLMAALATAGGLLAVVCGGAWKAACAASGSQQVEKRAAAYSGWNSKLSVLLIATASATASAAYAYPAEEMAPQGVLYAGGAAAFVGLVGSVIGGRGASSLLEAFDMQRAKGKAK